MLVHIEIQGQRETGFERRLYVYNYRIHDRFGAPVATFVILTDDDKNWRPTEYRFGLLGAEVRFVYSMVKLCCYNCIGVLPRWTRQSKRISARCRWNNFRN